MSNVGRVFCNQLYFDFILKISYKMYATKDYLEIQCIATYPSLYPLECSHVYKGYLDRK